MKETVLYTPSDRCESASLYVFDKTEQITKYVLGEYAKIGRKYIESDANIQLNSSIASKNHGVIDAYKDFFTYRDTGSLNGTYVNGKLLEKNSVHKLKDGDSIRIDQKNLNYTHSDSVLMIFLAGNDDKVWKTQELTEDTGDIIVGREASSKDSLNFEDDALSRKHATFRRGISGWSVIDNSSKNGVYVNNTEIDGMYPLHRLDVIRIAGTTFLYLGDKLMYNGNEAVIEQLSISIRERSVKKRFGNKQILLQNINLTINPCEMAIVLGGSGAGKTTFLNAVMGYEKADGIIRHGKKDIYKNYDEIKHRIGYVPQRDLVRTTDSVYMTLKDAAQMRLPKKTSKAEVEESINYCLDLFGLEREKHSQISKLSGGQLRRLNIAIEFVAKPVLFFLDEPDSGLDGPNAKSVMQNLRVIANEGVMVVVITHGPDRVAHLFDKIIVLAKSIDTNSGQLAYYGSIPDALKFFETSSCEEIVRKINRKDEGGFGLSDHFIQKYKELKGE